MLVDGEDTTTTESPSAPEGEGSKPQSNTPGPVPYSRFNEVVKQRNELQAEIAQLKARATAAENAKLDAEAAARKAAEDMGTAVKAESDKAAALQVTIDQYKQTFTSIVDDTTKEWPAELLAFDPGADADPVKRMEWMKNGKAMAEKLKGTSLPTSAPGAAPKPAPSTTQQPAPEVKLPIDVKRSF